MGHMRSRACGLLLMAASFCRAETSFYKDALPIFQEHCLSCHRAGEIGPMPLGTYAQVRPWAKAIREAVLSRKMPPWFADPSIGRFANDESLKPAEIRTLAAWVDQGAREGNPADAPKPREFAEGWRIPKPDAVFRLPEEARIPASGTLDYAYFVVPTGFKEDRWVDMVEVRPTNRAVVHHAIVYVQDAQGWIGPGQYLAGYAPGSVPQRWKPGQARLIQAGSRLIFQMHYTASGKPAVDRTEIGLVFARTPVKQRIVAMASINHWFEIPAGNPDYPVESVSTLAENVWLVGLRPHMHLRGKSFEFRAVYPDGKREALLRVPHYDFNWQPYYYLETPLRLPRGTRIECFARYDNSPNNPRNPDARVNVGWGEQSWDEMMIGWFDVAIPTQPGEPKRLGRILEPAYRHSSQARN